MGKKVRLAFGPPVDRILAYPTPDMRYMVVLLIYPERQTSQNAIFYDEEGKEFYRPTMPPLKTWERTALNDKFYWFANVSWGGRDDFVGFWIGKSNDDFFEFWEFNYKTLTWDDRDWERQRW